MRKGQIRLLVTASAALALAACNCEVSVGGGNPAKLAKTIKKNIKKTSGVDVEVTCPKIGKKEKGHCTATAGEVSFLVAVEQKGGQLAWQTDGVGFGKKIEGNIRDFYGKEHGWKFDSVACEPVIVAGKEPERGCTGKSLGIEIPFKVDIIGNDAKFQPLGGVVVGQLAESFATTQLEKNMNVVVKVACKDRLLVSKPGNTFDCTATDAQGESRVLQFTITTPDGNVSLKFKDAPK